MDTKWIPDYILNANKDSYWTEETLQKYKKAKNPKIVYVDADPKTGVRLSLNYAVGIIFDRNTIMKAGVSYGKFDPKKHSCTIYRWDPDAKINNDIAKINKEDVPTKLFVYPNGAYYPWLRHKRSLPTKWEKLDTRIGKKLYGKGHRIIPAHLFFKTEDDFKRWMGDEQYRNLFTDLLG